MSVSVSCELNGYYASSFFTEIAHGDLIFRYLGYRKAKRQMIVNRFVLLLALLLACSTVALKGGRRTRSSRGLQDIFDRPSKGGPQDAEEAGGAPSSKAGKNQKAGKEEASKQEEEKKDDKEKDKKCKGRPKVKEPKKEKEPKTRRRALKAEKSSVKTEKGSPKDSTEEEDGNAKEEANDEDEERTAPTEQWCENESIKKKGDCNSLRSGTLPRSSETVAGKLSVELTSDDKDTIAELQRVLKEETSLAAVGCAGKRRLQEGTEEDEPGGDEDEDPPAQDISLLAFDVGSLSKSNEGKYTVLLSNFLCVGNLTSLTNPLLRLREVRRRRLHAFGIRHHSPLQR